ncbi:MAG: ATP-grasp domain-containing protein, partial [Firmicutes bacterium]|jgi:hypothetical protein|nr:ATP-grasp domain-containing protein [Bacillota bacterium]
LARDGELLGQVVFRAIRVYPRDGGTSAYKVAIENSVVEAHDRALVRALRWTGFWSTDYMLDETTGECTLIDVNPRMAPGIILAYNAGCDLFGAYVDMLLRREVRAVHRPRPGTKARMQFLDLACLVDVFLHGADMTFGQKLAYLGEWRRRDSCYDDVIDRRDIKPLVMMYLFILRNLPRLLGPKGGEVFLEHVMFDEARFPPSAAALTAMAEAAPTGEWPVGEAAEAAR